MIWSSVKVWCQDSWAEWWKAVLQYIKLHCPKRQCQPQPSGAFLNSIWPSENDIMLCRSKKDKHSARVWPISLKNCLPQSSARLTSHSATLSLQLECSEYTLNTPKVRRVKKMRIQSTLNTKNGFKSARVSLEHWEVKNAPFIYSQTDSWEMQQIREQPCVHQLGRDTW